MSDTANPPNLASVDDFDARLKRTDEDRWLSSRYAPDAVRARLVAVYLLHQELLRAVGMSQPMLGKIRIQWWRETLEGIEAGGPVRQHDLSEELERVVAGDNVLVPAMFRLLDRFDDVIDDHLHAGGHMADEAHTARHMAAEADLMRLAGLCLDAEAARTGEAALGVCGEALLAAAAGLPDAAMRMTAARKAARELPAVLWPAVAHLAIATSREAQPLSPFARRWRLFRAILLRRL